MHVVKWLLMSNNHWQICPQVIFSVRVILSPLLTFTTEATAIQPVTILNRTNTVPSIINNQPSLQCTDAPASLIHLHPILLWTTGTVIVLIKACPWWAHTLSSFIADESLINSACCNCTKRTPCTSAVPIFKFYCKKYCNNLLLWRRQQHIIIKKKVLIPKCEHTHI